MQASPALCLKHALLSAPVPGTWDYTVLGSFSLLGPIEGPRLEWSLWPWRQSEDLKGKKKKKITTPLGLWGDLACSNPQIVLFCSPDWVSETGLPHKEEGVVHCPLLEGTSAVVVTIFFFFFFYQGRMLSILSIVCLSLLYMAALYELAAELLWEANWPIQGKWRRKIFPFLLLVFLADWSHSNCGLVTFIDHVLRRNSYLCFTMGKKFSQGCTASEWQI